MLDPFRLCHQRMPEAYVHLPFRNYLSEARNRLCTPGYPHVRVGANASHLFGNNACLDGCRNCDFNLYLRRIFFVQDRVKFAFFYTSLEDRKFELVQLGLRPIESWVLSLDAVMRRQRIQFHVANFEWIKNRHGDCVSALICQMTSNPAAQTFERLSNINWLVVVVEEGVNAARKRSYLPVRPRIRLVESLANPLPQLLRFKAWLRFCNFGRQVDPPYSAAMRNGSTASTSGIKRFSARCLTTGTARPSPIR